MTGSQRDVKKNLINIATMTSIFKATVCAIRHMETLPKTMYVNGHNVSAGYDWW